MPLAVSRKRRGVGANSDGGGLRFEPTQSFNREERIANSNSKTIYKKLNGTNRQIRLLKILSNDANVTSTNELRCSLTVASLDEPGLEFDALSYAWGQWSDRIPIKLNDTEYWVTRNLHEALTTFREDNSVPGFLWVDAISINQNDHPERGEQVSIMGDIFRRALTVHVWLGLEGRCTNVTLKTMRLIAPRHSEKSISQMDEPFVHGLADLMSRSWWSRVWVIQEATVATRPLLHCGHATIPLHEFIGSSIRIFKKSYRSDDAFSNTNSEERYLLVRLGLHMGMFLSKDLSFKGPSSYPAVFRIISFIDSKDTSDARDWIYGILGFLPSSIHIIPNYSLSVEDTYRISTLRLMTWSQSLSLLRCGGLHEARTLPTWVPDFRTRLVDATSLPSNACPRLPALIEERRQGELHVHALIVDMVHLSGCKAPARFIPDRTNSVVRDFRTAIKNWFFLAMPEQESHEYINMDIRARIWRTITMGRPVQAWRPEDREHAVKRDLASSDVYELNRWLFDENLEITPERTRYLFVNIFRRAYRRTFFITTQNRFGLTRGAVHQGDVLAIVAGSQLPIILRPVRDQYYRVVAACYSEGIMNGEIIPKVENSDARVTALRHGFKEIILV